MLIIEGFWKYKQDFENIKTVYKCQDFENIKTVYKCQVLKG